MKIIISAGESKLRSPKNVFMRWGTDQWQIRRRRKKRGKLDESPEEDLAGMWCPAKAHRSSIKKKMGGGKVVVMEGWYKEVVDHCASEVDRANDTNEDCGW